MRTIGEDYPALRVRHRAIEAGRVALEAALARLKDEATKLLRAAEGGQR